MKTQLFDAFLLHDQEGFTLDLSRDAASASEAEVNLAAFACDALGAGWSEEKVEREIKNVHPDVDWKEFRVRLAVLWTITGKLKDPDCWPVMKAYIVNAHSRASETKKP